MPPVQLTAADWIVLPVYLAGIAALGLFAGRKVHGSEGYFLGGRAFSKWLMLGQTFASGTRAGVALALPAHAGALQDPDRGVRMMSANALAAVGAPAAPALDALIQAGTAPGEYVQVLRSVADALGAIGPAAAKAVPVLEQLRKAPRLHWNADAAISKIVPR